MTVAAALLYGISFPRFSVFVAGFCFLVPLLYLLEKETKGKVPAFGIFFFFSFLSYLVMLYWIPGVMVRYGGMGRELSLFALVMLAAFFSLFCGVAGVLIKRFPLALAPVIWVVKDLVIEHVITGFPWCLAGYSQYRNLYFIQVAEIGGIHLVTFLLIGINVLLYLLLRRRDRLTAMALATALVGIYAAGYYLYRAHPATTAHLPVHRAGIIQPDTDNRPISHGTKMRILDRLLRESAELSRRGAEIIIWPEHTVSLYPLQAPRLLARLQAFVREHSPLLAGFTDRRGGEVYNSAVLFTGDGVRTYDKYHLTPFGEYVLYRELLFFIKRITDEISDFAAGDGVRNLEFRGRAVSTPICYEIIFPGLVRDFVALGGRLIITISNDSWFGDTSAPYQHLSMAVLRAVENRRYVLRSTTNGVSAVITPTGAIPYRSPHGGPDHFIAEFKYIGDRTFFNRVGYWFPYLCLAWLVGYWVFTRWGRAKKGERT